MTDLNNCAKNFNSCLALSIAATCGLPGAAFASEGDHHHEAGHNVAIIDQATLEEFGIEFAAAGPGVIRGAISLPGEIRYNREAFARLGPRYRGKVASIDARLSETARAGQTLATLVAAESLNSFPIEAPFDGAIVEYDLSLGQTVEAGAPLFAVADLSTVWADLSVYPSEASRVEKGMPVTIKAFRGDLLHKGVIAYVSPTMDRHTRVGLARVVVDNPRRAWKPGLFVSGRIQLETRRAEVVAPRSAVLDHEGEPVVFVKKERGFAPRAVTLGRGDAESYEILDGLEPGEIIATRNAISLKAELNKESFGGHAGHAH